VDILFAAWQRLAILPFPIALDLNDLIAFQPR